MTNTARVITIHSTDSTQVGTHRLSVTAFDGQLSTTSDTFRVDITNTPPAFSTPLEDKTIPVCGSIASYVVSFSDVNTCQSVTASVSSFPSFVTATITSSSVTFTY